MIKKIEPTPMFEGLAAGLQSQVAVGFFSIGLKNRCKTTAEDFARRMIFNVARTTWIKSFMILVTAGLWCVQLRGTTNVFETPPPQAGSIQWQNIQRLSKERQELYRKRVRVPGAVAKNVPRAADANLVGSRKIVAATKPAPAGFGMFSKILFFAAAFTFIGVLGARKFAPRVFVDLNQRFNPWALEPAAERVLPEKVRAEEEAFAKFLATFRVGPAASPRDDLIGKHDPIKEFYARAAKLLGAQRTFLQNIGRESDGPSRQKIIANLLSSMNSLKGEAGFPEALPVWQVASALEGLLKQLAEKTGNVTPSALRAVAGGVDLLGDLCVPGLKADILTERPLKFLVVDDDLISRQAMSLSLKKAFGQPDLAVDGETALFQSAGQAYDVIFLDVQLPGMDGFELCEKIRETGPNRTTPVVFVTGQSDFDARAKSALSGGNDLMGKPFLIFEITVKALTLALQGRLVRKPIPKLDQGRDKTDLSVTLTDNPLSVQIATRPLLSTPVMTGTDDFINAFLARASTHLGPLHELCKTVLQTSNEETRQNMLADGFLRINSLVSKNGSNVVHPAYQTCAALQGLFKKMLENPKHSTSSALATATAAVDLLADLCVPGLKADLATNPLIHLLVVDDDLVARRVIVGALQTVFSRPESAENGEAALALAVQKPFDVIFLDVQMPGMDGFEVCSKIRETAPNRATPVVFVTAHDDFETRARMDRHGGNDLMGKPFLTSEIIVKALTYVLRGRLEHIKTISHS
jgi:CheY-like chemotaxis protein